jgi:hypothetical protein
LRRAEGDEAISLTINFGVGSNPGHPAYRPVVTAPGCGGANAVTLSPGAAPGLVWDSEGAAAA